LREIISPTHCPACSTELVWIKDILYCENNLYCPAQSTKKVEHFAKTLKIKGLGPATIEKLEIFSIPDIYNLTKTDLVESLDSEKLGTKLHTEIEKSKTVDLITLLPAFSIPLIGQSASNKFRNKISTISEITFEKCKEVGLGPKAASNMMDWLINTFHSEEFYKLPFSFTCEKTLTQEKSKGTVCITGKLKSYKTKAIAQQILMQNGFDVKDNLTRDVNYLINESGIESAKTQKAHTMGITVYNNIKQLLTEKNHGTT